MKKPKITFCSFPDYTNNARSLYQYMEKKYKNHIYTWIVYNKHSVEYLKSKNINAILIGTDEFKKYIKTTDIFFTTQGNLDRDKTSKSLYIELWHGIGPKPTGFICKNPSKQDINGYGHMRNIIDYMFVPSEFWRIIYSAKFNVDYNRIIPAGFPVLDTIEQSSGYNNIKKITNKELKKYKKIIGYFPTYKKGFNHNDDINNNTNNVFCFKEYKEKELDEFLKENDILLIIKRHPGEQLKYKKIISENILEIDEEALQTNDLCIHEIMNGFDIIITDYSSLGTEFLYLNKPILLITSDYETYRKERGLIFDNLDFWTFGPKISDLNMLKMNIKKLLIGNDEYKKQRTEKKQLFYDDKITNNCENICNIIFNQNGEIKKEIKEKNKKLKTNFYRNLEYNDIKKYSKIYIDDQKDIRTMKLDIENKANVINRLETENERIELKITKIQEELERAYNSKRWQAIEKIEKIFKRKKR